MVFRTGPEIEEVSDTEEDTLGREESHPVYIEDPDQPKEDYYGQHYQHQRQQDTEFFSDSDDDDSDSLDEGFGFSNFPSMFGGSIFGGARGSRPTDFRRRGLADGFGMDMNMNFPDFDQLVGRMGSNTGGGSHSFTSYSSSSSYSSSGSDGRPVVVEKTHSSRSGPGGVSEVTKTYRDSRTATEKMMLERSAGDKSRRIVKKRVGGSEQTKEKLKGIKPEETEAYDEEWTEVAQKYLPSAHKSILGHNRSTKIPQQFRIDHQSGRRQ